MSTVYVFDGSIGMIKIVSRNGQYHVYPLENVDVKIDRRTISSMDVIYKPVKWVWSKQARRVYDYKPYEDRDVTTTPNVWISDISRLQNHLIHRVV